MTAADTAFMYPASGISPHPVHLAWAKSVGSRVVEAPMGIGFFDLNKLRDANVLLLESLYCAPFARRYKKKNPECKVVSIIADTSFWPPRLSLARRMFYRRYLGAVDGFLADSDRIRGDIRRYVFRPTATVRPFAVNRFRIEKRGLGKMLLFIGNEPREKGYARLVRAMEFLPDFELYLVGNCGRKVKPRENVHIEGRVSSLRKYFAKCSFYVHPADFEPFGVAVLEAMHAGLIPIISKDVGLVEMFTEELRELLVLKDNTPREIARRVLEVYNSNDREKIIEKTEALSRNWTREKSVKLFRRSLSRVLSISRDRFSIYNVFPSRVRGFAR